MLRKRLQLRQYAAAVLFMRAMLQRSNVQLPGGG